MCKHISLQLYKLKDLILTKVMIVIQPLSLTRLRRASGRLLNATENHHDKDIDGFSWVPSKRGNL